MKNTTYVIGHKNPDTDSVVSAVAFAKLKNLLGENEYVPARAGKLNPQTEYIFERFNLPVPEYIQDLVPKVAYYMNDVSEIISVNENDSLWNAVSLMQKNGTQVLPVVDSEGKYKSLVHYNVFAKEVLSILNPEHHISISTSVNLMLNSLKGKAITVSNENDVQKCLIVVGGASVESLSKTLDAHSNEKIIVITGDRDDLQNLCVEKKIHALIITAGKMPKDEIVAKAKANNVSILGSSFDNASTAILVSYSSPVSAVADNEILPIHNMDTLKKVKPLLQKSPSYSLPVIDDNDKLIGMISESDLLKDPNVQVSMVDHNEITQAVEGIENYTIREIIDHHRINAISTKSPMTFINRPVGSTATQIANMYRENKVELSKEIASILLCGVLSDTLILQSATTTDVDREVAEYLGKVSGLDIQAIGKDILSAGSKIGSRSAEEIINQDMKEFSENSENGKVTYTASQIEVEDPAELLARKKEFFAELELTRRSHNCLFSALLVTDIVKLTSVMLVASDEKFVPFITFPKQEENIYILKDVVSRKKQLIPMLTEVIANYK